MADITFDIAAFRFSFPQFANPAAFPDISLIGYWDAAICYISPNDYGYLNGASRARAINLMTAHLAALGVLILSGQQSGFVTNSAIDKISVAMQAPPSKNMWQYWLSSTPYGLQLSALLSQKGVGGLYTGGLPERDAFRKVYGVF